MNIVVALGKEYCQHTGVMLYSLIKNTHYLNDINLYIVTDSFDIAPYKKLVNFSKKIGYKVNLIRFDSQTISSFPVTHHISIATYFRLLLPELLPNNINKILYLDSDIIIQGDVQELWNTNLNNLPLAAVRDHLHYKSRREIFDIKESSLYFNGGILLIDLEKWRNRGMSSMLVEFIQSNPDKILWWDQDALNGVFGNEYLLLEDKWNVQTSYIDKHNSTDYTNFNIIHYTSEKKPWLYQSNHPLKEYYFKYLKYTPWWHYPYILAFNVKLEKLRHRIRKLLNF